MALIILCASSGCYKDNEEELYPQIALCDSTNVSYTQSIAPLLQLNCYACHSNASAGVAGAGISIEGYENLNTYISNNKMRFLGALNHENAYSAMPKGGAKLPSCELAKIKNWIDEGMANN